MKPYIIGLKLKDTEEVKWKKALAGYLKRVYGTQQWSQFFDEKLAAELDHSRNNANGELSVDSLLEQNCLYYAYIEQLNLRLGNNSGLLKLDFVWYDADYTLSNESQKYKQHSLIFEKAAVLYNIAVLMSICAKESAETDYKAATAYISKAMMCFNFLSENFLNAPSIDLHAENTKYLANICHAEAQEMFTMKLMNGDTPEKQASLISKLALCAYNLYDRCSDFQKRPDGGLAPYGEPRWSTIVTCKLNFFRGAAAYYHALALEQQNKIGEAIAFMGLAVNALMTAIPFKAFLDDYIDFDGFKETVEDKRRQLTKDNDFIYHDAIPASVSVESIKPMDAVKAPTWPDQLQPYMDKVMKKCEILYKGIVPMEAYEKESIYSDQKDSLLRRETDAAETANFEYKSFIEYTNLDSLVRDLEKRYRDGDNSGAFDAIVNNMRDALSGWSQSVQKSRFKDIGAAMAEIASKRKDVTEILSTLPPDQRENGVKLKTSLIEASKSDDKLFSLIKPYSEEINLLNNPDKLWKNFNAFNTESSNQPSLLDVDDTKTAQILDKIREIKNGSEALRVLNTERSSILSELKEKVNEDDITSLVIANNGKSDDLKELFAKELDKFSPLTSRLEATVFKQASLINDIKIQLDDVFSISGLKSKAAEESEHEKKRREFYDKMEGATVAFATFNNDIVKGLQFYDSLIRMSNQLIEASRNQSQSMPGQFQNAPPPLPQQPYAPQSMGTGPNMTLDSQMANLSMGTSSLTPTIPPRTYNTASQPPPYTSMAPPIPVPGNFAPQPSNPQYQPTGQMAPMVPQKPPRMPGQGVSTPMGRNEQTAREEAEIQRNPTAFYDKSSVFDENLYSKYSK